MEINKFSVFFIILFYLICYWLTLNVLDSIGYATTLILLLLFFFRKWLWKLKIIKKITKIENLQGEWIGTLYSSFDNSNHTIEKVIIKQSYNKYKIIMETKESKSKSEICEIKINDFDRNELQYIYINEAPVTLRKKNPMHFGIANLEFKDNELIGTYWTDREIKDNTNTRGTIKLKKINNRGNYDLISIFDIFNIF